MEYYSRLMEWLVNTANTKLFHVREVLVPVNGSGDTSYGWAELFTFLTLASLGCFIWSVIDHRRRQYTKLNYWLCISVRYYIAGVAFGYGIYKILLLQMPFPSTSQMVTPLGDFL